MGAAILAFTWWSYGVTHQAFESIRGFSRLLDDERMKFTQVVEKASGLSSGVPNTSATPAVSGTEAPSGAGPGSGARTILSEIQNIVGRPSQGSGSGSTGTVPSSLIPPSSQTAEFLRTLETQLRASQDSWDHLGSGPLPSDHLGRMELSINLLLVSSLVFGLVLIGFGIKMLTPNSAPKSMDATSWGNNRQR